MVRLISLVLGGIIVISSAWGVQAQIVPERGGDTPVGMEAVQVTPGYRLLVPQGAKIRHIGAQVIVEDDREYFSRRFYELSQQIDDLNNQIKTLQDQIAALQEKKESSAVESSP